MRKIEWDPGTYSSTRERASAIAWASNRRGSRVWTGKNVTQQITDYLHEHGYRVSRYRVLAAMKKLVAEKYAYMRLADGQRSVVEWGFMPDIELTGHGLPENEDMRVEKSNVRVHRELKDSDYDAALALPPIPGAGEAPLYRLDELEKLLKAWAEKDHETYASWVDASIESLRHNT